MKHHILSFLLLLLCLHSSAQRLQMNDTTNRWTFVRTYEVNPGHTFKSEWSSIDEAENTKQVNGYEYAKLGVWFRDDTLNRKVYVWDSTSNADILIMDYTLNMGDTFRATYKTTTIAWGIGNVDSIMINGYPHRRMGLLLDDFNTGYCTLEFIEGVGFTILNPLAVWSQLLGPYPNWNGVPTLGCFKNSTGIRLNNSKANDSTCLYHILNIPGLQTSKSPGIYPQPASQKATMVLPAEVDDAILSIYEISGRVVHTQRISKSASVEILNSRDLNGIYFYRVSGSNTPYAGKIVFK